MKHPSVVSKGESYLQLETVAMKRGFEVVNDADDGNCMFADILHQISHKGHQTMPPKEFGCITADYIV